MRFLCILIFQSLITNSFSEKTRFRRNLDVYNDENIFVQNPTNDNNQMQNQNKNSQNIELRKIAAANRLLYKLKLRRDFLINGGPNAFYKKINFKDNDAIASFLAVPDEDFNDNSLANNLNGNPIENGVSVPPIGLTTGNQKGPGFGNPLNSDISSNANLNHDDIQSPNDIPNNSGNSIGIGPPNLNPTISENNFRQGSKTELNQNVPDANVMVPENNNGIGNFNTNPVTPVSLGSNGADPNLQGNTGANIANPGSGNEIESNGGIFQNRNRPLYLETRQPNLPNLSTS